MPTAIPPAPGYHPAAFPLFEADLLEPHGRVVRWLSGWNGLVTEPATDVTLAVRAPGSRAIVTSGRWRTDADARAAAMMARNTLDGDPVFPTIDAVTAACCGARWTASTLRVDGSDVEVRATTHDGIAVACTPGARWGFAVAARGDFSIRTLHETDAYPASPLESHDYASLERLRPPTMS